MSSHESKEEYWQDQHTHGYCEEHCQAYDRDWPLIGDVLHDDGRYWFIIAQVDREDEDGIPHKAFISLHTRARQQYAYSPDKPRYEVHTESFEDLADAGFYVT